MVARTQIYLPEPEHRRARIRAAEQGISLSEYIRRLIKRDLETTEPAARTTIDEIFGLAAAGEPTDVGRDKDRLLGEAIEAVEAARSGRARSG
jgi:hypothetical protein